MKPDTIKNITKTDLPTDADLVSMGRLVSPRQQTTEEKEFTKMMMTTGVDADGIVEDEYIETWLLPIERIDMDKRGFIRLHMDNGGTDAEARLSINDMKNTLAQYEKMLATG